MPYTFLRFCKGRVNSTPSSEVIDFKHNHHYQQFSPKPQGAIRSSADFISDDFQDHFSEPNLPPHTLDFLPFGLVGDVGQQGVASHSQSWYAPPTEQHFQSATTDPNSTGPNSYSPGDLEAITFFPQSSQSRKTGENAALVNPSNR